MSVEIQPARVPVTPSELRSEAYILAVSFVRILWKEIFEFQRRPIVLCVILALSIGATLAAGNLNIKQPVIRVQLYKPNRDITPTFATAKDILEQFSNVQVIDRSGSFLNLELRVVMRTSPAENRVQKG